MIPALVHRAATFLPHHVRSFSQQAVKQGPLCYRPAKGVFSLHNFNFRQDKERILNFANLIYQRHTYKEIFLERAAVIGEERWVKDLLTHISKSGVKRVDIIGRSAAYAKEGKEELVQPTIQKVRSLEDRLMRLEGRPEILELKGVQLTRGMIATLASTLSSGSHATNYQITLRP